MSEIDDIRKEIIKELLPKAKIAGKLIENEAAIRKAPWKSGSLARSIHSRAYIENESIIIELSANVKSKDGFDYPSYQEGESGKLKTGTPENPFMFKTGAGRTAARPFLASSLWSKIPEMERIFNR